MEEDGGNRKDMLPGYVAKDYPQKPATLLLYFTPFVIALVPHPPVLRRKMKQINRSSHTYSPVFELSVCGSGSEEISLRILFAKQFLGSGFVIANSLFASNRQLEAHDVSLCAKIFAIEIDLYDIENEPSTTVGVCV